MLARIMLILGLLSGCCFSAELILPTVFSDHMVLQREQPVPVWGKADPGTEVAVEFAGQKKIAMASASGRWQVILDPMPASSESRVLKVSCNHQSAIENLKFSDVLVGEVWLCSGQSNMELSMDRTANAAAAIAEAIHPKIRLYQTPEIFSRTPVEQIDAAWSVCTPESVKSFSGVAYYFGRKLNQDLNVPVGLLQSAYGGTPITAWTPPDGFKGYDTLKAFYRQAEELSQREKIDRATTSGLYNGMLYAHVPFAIRGAIWYQGERDHKDGMLYVDKTRALLNGWRSLWGYEFPFYFVQIAPYAYGDEDPALLPLFWEAESMIVKTVPQTGMAVISDCATPNNIHPPNKKDPGIRLALLALDHTYGKDLVSSGPVFQTLEEEGGCLTVHFGFAEGLSTRDGKAPDWFEIAGPDGVFKPAQAEISGSSVLLRSSEVPHPIAMRFAWNKVAEPNLVNGAGLPASAFRTDCLTHRD